MAIEACPLCHISTLSGTTPNSIAGECWEVCVCFIVHASLCVCKTQRKEKSSCTKGMADTVLHSVSFLKLKKSDWTLSLPINLNFMTMARHYPPTQQQHIKWNGYYYLLFLLYFSFSSSDCSVALNLNIHIGCKEPWWGMILWCSVMWSSELSDVIHETV